MFDKNLRQEDINQALSNEMTSNLYQFIVTHDESSKGHLSLIDLYQYGDKVMMSAVTLNEPE